MYGKLDIDGKYITLKINLYCNQKTHMRTEDGSSQEIHITKEVRQGCVFTSITLSAQYVHRKQLWSIYFKRGMTVGGKSIHYVRYIDGTVLFAEI